MTWLLVTGLTFSFMAGIFHAYYTVALAPAVAALVGIGAIVLWRRRDDYAAALVMSGTVAFTAMFGFVLLERTPDYLPWLKWVVALLGLSSALALAGVRHLPRRVGLLAACRGARRRTVPRPRRTPSRPRERRTPARSSAPVPRAARAGWVSREAPVDPVGCAGLPGSRAPGRHRRTPRGFGGFGGTGGADRQDAEPDRRAAAGQPVQQRDDDVADDGR